MAETHRCEKETAAGDRCKRIHTTMTNGKWLCKQHGGKGSLPSCQKCKKSLSKSRVSTENMCEWCSILTRLEVLRNEAVTMYPNLQRVIDEDDDPINVE